MAEEPGPPAQKVHPTTKASRHRRSQHGGSQYSLHEDLGGAMKSNKGGAWIDQNELSMAAYLGLKTNVELRKLVVSQPVLKYAPVLRRCSLSDLKKVFRLLQTPNNLQELASADDIESLFDIEIDKFVLGEQTLADGQRDTFIATILSHAYDLFANLSSSEPSSYMDDLNVVIDKFPKVDGFEIPCLGLEDFSLPNLTANDSVIESHIERFRRVWHLFAYANKKLEAGQKKDGEWPDFAECIQKLVKSGFLTPRKPKPVTQHDIPSWMRTKEIDPDNVTPSSPAIQNDHASSNDTSLRKCTSTIIKCVQETAASFLPHVASSSSINEFAAKVHRDSSNQEQQQLQGGPKCLNGTYSKRIETTISYFGDVEKLLDFLVSQLDLQRWHLVIADLWFCAKPSHLIKFAENNLASLDGDENGIYPIYSSNPNSETAWSKALSAAEVSSGNDLSHTIFFTLKTFPTTERYPNFADFTDVQGLLASVRVESMDRDINKSILKITEAICETGTTELALCDTNRHFKVQQENVSSFVQKVKSRSEGKKLPPAGHWTTEGRDLNLSPEEEHHFFRVPGIERTFDLRVDQERLEWQRSIIETVLKSVDHMARRRHNDRQPQLSRDPATQDHLESLSRADLDRSIAMDPAEPDSDRQEIEAIDALVTGSEDCIGPPLNASANFLFCQEVTGSDPLPKFTCSLAPNPPGLRLMAHQITGAVAMLLCLFKDMPDLSHLEDLPLDQQRLHASARIELETYRFPTMGLIVADATGMGKTIQTIIALDVALKVLDGRPEEERLPSIILTSSPAVARQWLNQMAVMHPGWTLITDRGNHSEKINVLKTKDAWGKKWPPKLRWVWSKRVDDRGNDPRRVIFIMTYGSWASKTLKTRVVKGEEEYFSTFASKTRHFEILVCDEAHRLKQRSTANFKAASLIVTRRVLLLTATPCLNDPKDYLALAELIWNCRRQTLTQEERDFLRELKKVGYGRFEETIEGFFCELDNNRTNALKSTATHPEIVQALIRNSTDEQNWEAGFRHFSSVAMLRRSAGSTIFRDRHKKKPVKLTSVLPELRSSSVSMEMEAALKPRTEYAALMLYGQMAIDYEQWIKEAGPSSKIPPPTTSYYWSLALLASSWPAFKLSGMLKRVGSSARSTDVEEMRRADVNLIDISPLLRETYDPNPSTAYQHVFLAIRGSPQVQELLGLICNKVLRSTKDNNTMPKVLATLQSPFLAFYTEQILKFLRIPTAVRYGNMDPETDIEVIRSFRSQEPGSVQVLLQPYTCGREGINLDGPCHFVFVMEPAYSGPVEDQTTARVHRASTEHPIKVVRCYTTNSIHEYWHYKHLKKRALDLAAQFSRKQAAAYLRAIEFIYSEIGRLAKSHLAKHLENSHSVSLLTTSDHKKRKNLSDDQLPNSKRAKTRVTFEDSEVSANPSASTTHHQHDGQTMKGHRRFPYRGNFGEIESLGDYYNAFKVLPYTEKLSYSSDLDQTRRAMNIHSLVERKAVNEMTIAENLSIRDIGYEAVHAVRTGLPFGGWRPTPKPDFGSISDKLKDDLLSKFEKAGVSLSSIHDFMESVELRHDDQEAGPQDFVQKGRSRHSVTPSFADNPASNPASKPDWISNPSNGIEDDLRAPKPAKYFPRSPLVDEKWDRLSTSGVGFKCVVHAVVVSIRNQYPDLPAPTVDDLVAHTQTEAYHDSLAPFLLQDQNKSGQFYNAEQACTMLKSWGASLTPPENFNLTVMHRNGTEQPISIDMESIEDPTKLKVLWVYFDACYVHYEGLKKKESHASTIDDIP